MGAANGERLAADVARLAESLVNIPGPVAGPTLVVVSGLPGTGKSYFSARLAEKLDFLVLESDALRKTRPRRTSPVGVAWPPRSRKLTAPAGVSTGAVMDPTVRHRGEARPNGLTQYRVNGQ